MKMTCDDLHIMQITDIHDAALIERGFHPDFASISYVEKYAALAEQKEVNEETKQIDQNIKKEVIKRHAKSILNDYIFAAFIHKLVSNPDELFVYKKQFTSYFVSLSFFSYALAAVHKDLNSVMFCKRPGKVYYSTYTLNYVNPELIARNEAQVPFRLTPNLQYFMTPIGVEGPFAGAITATNVMSLEKKKCHYFCDYLMIFYRDLFEAIPEPNRKAVIQKNYQRTIGDILGLLDIQTIEKLFK